jgi:hypothetical protein
MISKLWLPRNFQGLGFAASMMTVRVLVAVRPALSVAK